MPSPHLLFWLFSWSHYISLFSYSKKKNTQRHEENPQRKSVNQIRIFFLWAAGDNFLSETLSNMNGVSEVFYWITVKDTFMLCYTVSNSHRRTMDEHQHSRIHLLQSQDQWTLALPCPPLVWSHVWQPFGRAGICLPLLLQLRSLLWLWPPGNMAQHHLGHNPSPLTSSKWSLFHPYCLQCHSDRHSIHIIQRSRSFISWPWGASDLKDMSGQKMEDNWLWDDHNCLILAEVWKAPWDLLYSAGRHLQLQWGNNIYPCW